MYEQHFYVEGTFLGSVVRPAMIVHAERQPPYSYVYLCPDCGEVWARCPVKRTDYDPPRESKWQVQGGYCRQHPGPSPFTVAGSLLLSWEPEYSNLLLSCPDVVKWEFERHMEFIERRIAND
jgi:hypothetical protein